MSSHPYFPSDADIDYVPNDWHFLILLAIFGAGCAGVLSVALLLARQRSPHLARSELLVVLWFSLSAGLHLLFESYFIINFGTIASQQHLFAQLWKEYALSDSRYLTQDPFVLCVELITVVLWGPLSLLTAYMIVVAHPARHGFQIFVSSAHLYGVLLYYSTCLSERYMLGLLYSRPEFLYYWVYFVGFNAPWLFVPVMLIWSSLKEISRLSQACQDNGKTGKK